MSTSGPGNVARSRRSRRSCTRFHPGTNDRWVLTTVRSPRGVSTTPTRAERGSSLTTITFRGPGSHIGKVKGMAGSRTTCQERTGYRESRAMPYVAVPGCSSPVAAVQVAPGVPAIAAAKCESTAPMAPAATAVRSARCERGWSRSTSWRARTSASRSFTAVANRSTSTRSSASERPCRMLKVARRTRERYPVG
jgi:hypothetical protein